MVRPYFQAKFRIGSVVEDDYQVEVEGPWDGCCQSDYPDDEDHQTSSSFGYLTFQWPPNSKESATKLQRSGQ